MDAAESKAKILKTQIEEAEQELASLRKQLEEVEQISQSDLHALNQPIVEYENPWPLSQEEYTRYGRQMIVPDFGIHGKARAA